jgi:hypothetical protein
LGSALSQTLGYINTLVARFGSFKENFSSSNPVSGMEQAFRSLAITIDDVGIALSKLMRNKDMENAFKKNRDASLKILAEGRRASKTIDGNIAFTNPRMEKRSGGGKAINEPSGITSLLDTLDMDKLVDRDLESTLAKEQKIRLLIKEKKFELDLASLRSKGMEQEAQQMEIYKSLGIAVGDKYTLEMEQIDLVIAKHIQFNKQLEFQNKIVGIGERVFDRAADGIMRAMQRGENAMESFKNVAMAALFDVGQEMLKLAVMDPLKKAGSSFLMKMAGSIGGSIGGSLFGGSSGGGTDFDMQMAGGGYLQAGKTALVGERGKELFTPSVGGTITPNNELGGAVNVTLNLSTGVQSTVRSEVMGLMPMITSQVKNAVAEARQRGGSFSEAMGV